MKVLHPEQLNSSLGISKALQEEYQSLDASDKYRKRVLTDTMFLVPTKQSNILIWARFYMALYYKRVGAFVIYLIFLLICQPVIVEYEIFDSRRWVSMVYEVNIYLFKVN